MPASMAHCHGRNNKTELPQTKRVKVKIAAFHFDTAPRGIGLDFVRAIWESRSESIRSFQAHPAQRRKKDQMEKIARRLSRIDAGRSEAIDALKAIPTK